MTRFNKLLSPSVLASALLAATVTPCAFAQTFNSGSTGADGAFNPTGTYVVQLPPSGILNYTTVNIPVGVTVTFIKNAANTPVYLLASGNVTIAGTIDIRGKDAASTGTDGNGALGDDGNPGVGGPGGFDGGRGGREDAAQVAAVIRGGAGLGPGGGSGSTDGADNSCTATGYYKSLGTGGAFATNTYSLWAISAC